jgi:hypothetical protein
MARAVLHEYMRYYILHAARERRGACAKLSASICRSEGTIHLGIAGQY